MWFLVKLSAKWIDVFKIVIQFKWIIKVCSFIPINVNTDSNIEIKRSNIIIPFNSLTFS